MENFFEKAYHWELERKDRLNTAASFPVGLAVVCVTLLNFSVEKGKLFSCESVAESGLFIISCVFISAFTGNTVRFFIGYEYKYLGTTKQFAEYRDKLRHHKAQYPEAQDVDITFAQSLEHSFANCADHNCLNNDKKSNALYWMNITIFFSLLFAVACGGVVTLTKPSGTPAIEIKLYGK